MTAEKQLDARKRRKKKKKKRCPVDTQKVGIGKDHAFDYKRSKGWGQES